jgi:hypothetical protein
VRSQKQELVVAEDLLHKVARLTRRLPGYRTVRRRAVPWIRKSATARALAYRLFAMESRRSAALVEPPLELSAGRLLGGAGAELLPVILLSLVGLADGNGRNRPIGDVVAGVIDDVAEMQLLGAGFRPVFLLDTAAFSRARSYGYVAELVTPRSAWSAESADWSEYIGARIASMRTNFGVSAVITIAPDGLDDVARGVLRSFG